MDIFSYIFGLDNYLGFYTNFIIHAMGARLQIMVLITSASFHLGICMYLRGMVQDLRSQLTDTVIEFQKNRPNFAEISKKFARQIDFHDNMLK